MINFSLTIHKLFFMHEWEERDMTIDKTNFEVRNDYSYAVYILRCKSCGTLKRKKIKL